MNDLIKDNREVFFSVIYLLLSLFVYLYFNHYMVDLNRYNNIAKLNNLVRSDLDKMKAAKELAENEQIKKSSTGLDSFPSFLQELNKISNKCNVIIDKLVPDQDNEHKFTLEFIADYYTFVNFTADLESLSIILDDLQIHPYDASTSPPLHAISFSLTAYDNGRQIENERLKQMKTRIANKDKRNPFQRYAYSKVSKKVSQEIDLTWIHKLQGIGVSPDGGFYATIDQMNYRKGDNFNGMEVVEIQSRHVKIESRNELEGTKRYLIKFRSDENSDKKKK